MFLPVVVAGLLSVGPLLGIVSGEFPVADAHVPFLSQGPMAVEPSATFSQIAPFSQPENSDPLGLLHGPVPVAVLVQYGLANNPEIQAARYRARALGARVPQAASLPDPALMTNVFLESIQTAAGPQEVAMNLSQQFPWFGKLALRSEVAYYEGIADKARLLVELAQSCQPELRARSRELCRDRASAELACRNYWPDPTVSFQWYDIGSQGLSQAATGEDAYALGVGMNLPLHRKRLDAAVRESQYNTARSAQQVAASRDQFRAEVQSLYAQFSQHDQMLEILGSEIVPAAAQTLDLSIEAYRVGRLDFQQLIGNYRSLLKYRIDYHKREAMREQAVASIERAVGCDIAAGAIEAKQ